MQQLRLPPASFGVHIQQACFVTAAIKFSEPMDNRRKTKHEARKEGCTNRATGVPGDGSEKDILSSWPWRRLLWVSSSCLQPPLERERAGGKLSAGHFPRNLLVSVGTYFVCNREWGIQQQCMCLQRTYDLRDPDIVYFTALARRRSMFAFRAARPEVSSGGHDGRRL